MQWVGMSLPIPFLSKRERKVLSLKALGAYLEVGCEWHAPRERWVRSIELEEEEGSAPWRRRSSGVRKW